MTPFKELAERIEALPYDTWFCCNELKDVSHRNFFKDFFMPTEEEAKEYLVSLATWLFDRGAWLSTSHQKKEQDNYDRITALLFADQLWQDEANRKYERK